MKKIAFILNRYGAGMNGGAEVHCHMLAKRLLPFYNVEVLTTTIRVFKDPAKDYPEGVDSEHNILIRRFKPRPADCQHAGWIRRKHRFMRRVRYYLAQTGVLRLLSAVHPVWTSGAKAEAQFLKTEVDYAPELLQFIEEHQDEYAALIFMNFYSGLTVFGSAIAPEKSILIPLAHPDKPLYYSINTRVFTHTRHIAFNTDAERRLCHRIFGCAMAPNSIVGAGIEEAPPAEWSEVKVKYGLPDQYALYLGRVTRGKINDLIPDFLNYKNSSNPEAKLVLVGGVDPKITHPGDPNILFTGFVTEEEKSTIIRHAALMINPSKMESLSLLMLEAMENRIPVLVNGKCEVMKDHCKQSGAALYYNNPQDFRRKLHRLFTNPELRRQLGNNGPAYVEQHYDWDLITGKLRSLIETI